MDLLRIERSIRLVRGDKVILDEDLAALYGVETKKLIQAVKRNPDSFPADFMFQLTNQELKDLKSQFATSSSWGGRRTSPYAFSEQGVAMLSNHGLTPLLLARSKARGRTRDSGLAKSRKLSL